ncbi:MAG: beta-N-acetylhexosaminidase [Bacteroidales bacterium]|nr:beta-N-acetylhexosaminidase [Bacteroidales bacterium]
MKKLFSLILGFAFCFLSYAAGEESRGGNTPGELRGSTPNELRGGNELRGSTPDCILPQVAQWTPAKGGSFVLSNGAVYRLQAKGVSDDQVKAFKAYIESSSLALREAGKEAASTVKTQADKEAASAVKIQVGPKLLKDTREGAYKMTVDCKGVSIQANGVAGAFYAVQSLMQLQAADEEGRIAACRIEDAPRYAYRGLMFDVSRHFHSKDFILKQIDLMAQLKMNRLHLHLTDNEGWRIALDCAPEMVKKGAFGDSWWFNHVLNGTPMTLVEEPAGYEPGTVYDDGKVYGGYYTKDQIREIIAYAADRHFEVIPEIEIPGHNIALLRVHPEFFCENRKYNIDNVVCPGREEVFAFFENVLKEVMELFPSRYVHIGGDEANKSNWGVCPLCQKRIADEHLKDVYELQSYCIRRVEKMVNACGKQIIGWDEILQGGLSDNATVMSWRGTEGGVQAIRMNHDVIMTPSNYYYLDFGQDAPYKEPLAFNTYLPLETVYSYEPEEDIIAACGADYDPSIMKHLLGLQGNLWGECIVSESHFEYMLYPRAFAIAENAWSPKGSKNYPAFREKTLAFIERVRKQGYHTFDLASEVGHRPAAATPIVNLALGAKTTWRNGGKEETADMLVDGYLGDWVLWKSPQWKECVKRELVLDIDLGESKDLHYIGAEFVHFPARRCQLPNDLQVLISEDGINYTPVPVVIPELSKEDRHFSILTLGATVNAKARYVRLEGNKEKKKTWGYIGEIIIN